MPKKQTQEEFVSRSRKIHGDKYGYSKVKYVNSKTKVILECKEHGDFLQSPYNHINKKSGCSLCSKKACSKKLSLTTEEFIRKAKDIFGELYDYSECKYVNSKTKIRIKCKKHGDFFKTPNAHLVKKQGCTFCGNESGGDKNRMSQVEFIKRANEIHNNRFDYSKVKYKNAMTNIIIICPLEYHGEFKQMPSKHLSGQQCPKCAGRFMDTVFFKVKAKEIHKDKYDYSLVEYKRNNQKVIIICPDHGKFYQKPNDHISGKQGCPKCGDIERAIKRRSNTEEFVEKAILIHQDKYDYYLVNYKQSNHKVKIVCNKCKHQFRQTPTDHLQGFGCPKCAGKCITTSDFIQRAIRVHGDMYDYSQVEYKKTDTKVKIICHTHGIFLQAPHSHLNGRGCPRCFKNYSKKQMKWLHYLSVTLPIQHMENKGEFVIPNTCYSVDGYDPETKTIYEFHGDFWHGNPNVHYHKDVNRVNNKSFGQLFKNTLRKELILQRLGYKYKCVWESDWDRAVKAVMLLQKKWRELH